MTDSKKALLSAGAVLVVAFVMALVQDNNKEIEINTSGAANNGSQKVIGPNKSVTDKTRGSDLVIIGTVDSARASYQTTASGDKPIVTTVSIIVEDTLKGAPGGIVELEMLGGTVNGITMVASHQPALLKAKERAAVFIKRGQDGKLRAVGENGVLPLSNGKFKDGEQSWTVEQLKSMVSAGL